HSSCGSKSRSCIGQNLPCAETHIAASAAGIACGCCESGKLKYAIRIFPPSTYSRLTCANDESCHIRQNGHSKSLTMMSQTFAEGLPVIRPWSAFVTSESGADARATSPVDRVVEAA